MDNGWNTVADDLHRVFNTEQIITDILLQSWGKSNTIAKEWAFEVAHMLHFKSPHIGDG